MTGLEAIKAIYDGKKVRMTTWPKGQYAYRDIGYKIIDNLGQHWENIVLCWLNHSNVFELYKEQIPFSEVSEGARFENCGNLWLKIKVNKSVNAIYNIDGTIFDGGFFFNEEMVTLV